MRWLLLAAALAVSGAPAADLNADRQAELDHLLRHDCGSCHGLRLQGGLGQFEAKHLMTLALANAGRLGKFGA